LLPQWVEAGWIRSDAVSAFAAVDAVLTEMSGVAHAELWTVAALREAPEWAHVRELAAKAVLLV
jgi:hypothetical protein